MSSGYTHCPCRGCFEITVSGDVRDPDMCHACIQEGCATSSECLVFDDGEGDAA